MILQVLILFALSDFCQAWWSKCDKYENRHEFCAVLFSKEDCRGDAIQCGDPSLVHCCLSLYLSHFSTKSAQQGNKTTPTSLPINSQERNFFESQSLSQQLSISVEI